MVAASGWGSVALPLGAVVEILVEMTAPHLCAPPLFPLLATFGLTLMVEDLVTVIWGPADLLGPARPGTGGRGLHPGPAVPGL